MKKTASGCIVTILITALLCAVFPYHTASADTVSWPSGPAVNAQAAIVMEASTGMILYDKNITEALYPASTTKIMTALLAIEQCPLSDIVTCPMAIDAIDRASSRIGLVGKEQLTLEDALYGMLLASGNEVAYAIGDHVADGDMDKFISMMNTRAAELGCMNTNFVNAHGLDDPSHYTCAYDLAVIMRKAISYSVFCRISNTRSYTIPPTNLNVERPVANTHRMLKKEIACEGIIAGKTGFTDLAGTCLVTCAQRDGITLICVVMKEPETMDAYNETTALLNFGFENFQKKTFSGSDTSHIRLSSLFGSADTLITGVDSLLYVQEAEILFPTNSTFADVEKEIVLYPMDTFTEGENIIGRVNYYYSDRFIGYANVVYQYSSDYLNSINAAMLESKPVISETPADLRPLIIAVIIGGITLVIGLYVVFIEIPYRKKRRKYQP